MRAVFADTGYWVAVIHPHDGLHEQAMAVSAQLGECSLVSSEMVLVEVLNTFSGRGQHLREAASRTVREITADPNVEVFPQTPQLFREALALYEARADKNWSLTDCASFVIMKKRRIDEALTDDHHYIQNGFKALLKT
jgi:predicted nucleic acid-binding protein